MIYSNLILNASEALGDQDGVISVSIARVAAGQDLRAGLEPGGYIRLSVSDTGCGIPEHIRARIFDPFFTTKAAGRGLGLAAGQGIVRSHRGAINLVSEPGHGSCFEILLPCAVPSAADTPKILEAPVASSNGGCSGTVLVVEDEDTLRYPVAKILRRRGFHVLEAGDGISAVDCFRAQNAEIGVVLLDMTLPSMSGPEVFDEVSKLRPDMKVILTSAYREETVMSAMGERQPWAYIRKPYSPGELASLLTKACCPDKN